MGLLRVFRRSVRFTFRSKRRFIVFLIIFAIVSTTVAFNVDQLESLTTDELLDQKGVVVKKSEGANISYTQGNSLYNDILGFAESSSNISIESSALYTYADIDSFLRIHSLDIDNPWLSDFANPSSIQQGSFPDEPNEILVPEGALETRNITIGGEVYELQSRLSIGQHLDFEAPNGDRIELVVSGIFDDTEYEISNRDNQLWLFMDQPKFDDMIDLFGMTKEDDVQTYMMSFVVEGLVLTPSTYQQADALNEEVKVFLEDEATYGNFQDVPESLPVSETLENSNTILVTLIFVVVGGVVLSTLFAYLISRFRRREIAILKAMGYSHGSVRVSLIGELITTSFSGFIVGLGLAQLMLLVGLLEWISGGELADTLNFNNLIRQTAVGFAFLIMVVISLPGMFLVSRRILSVSPAEAFRDN